MATKMLPVLLIILVVGGVVGQDSFPCAPANLAEYDFRELTSGITVDSVPTQDQLNEDINAAPAEIRDRLQQIVTRPIIVDHEEEVITQPYRTCLCSVSPCCSKPNFQCTSIEIPLWYIRYYRNMCYIIYPERPYSYTRCTCAACLVNSDCPVAGSCVETGYRYVKVLAYCPKYYYYCYTKFCRVVKLLIALPTQCQCMKTCPYSPPYLLQQSSSALDRAAVSGSAAESKAEETPLSTGVAG